MPRSSCSVGVTLGVAPLLVVYAAHGKLLALAAGYTWTLRLFSGLPWDRDPRQVTRASFASYRALIGPARMPNAVGVGILEDFMCAAIVITGFARCAIAIARKRVDRRTIVVAALSAMTAMTLRDVFVGSQHLEPARYVRAHTRANDAVYCTTWIITFILKRPLWVGLRCLDGHYKFISP